MEGSKPKLAHNALLNMFNCYINFIECFNWSMFIYICFLVSAYAPVKPLKSSFTMKREFDKAREEQELISKLREVCVEIYIYMSNRLLYCCSW